MEMSILFSIIIYKNHQPKLYCSFHWGYQWFLLNIVLVWNIRLAIISVLKIVITLSPSSKLGRWLSPLQRHVVISHSHITANDWTSSFAKTRTHPYLDEIKDFKILTPFKKYYYLFTFVVYKYLIWMLNK